MEVPNKKKSTLSKKWLVVYTRARWEKKVDVLFKQRGIISYCPTKKVLNQWADRKKIVELPLFSSYVFVHIDVKEENLVRQTHGVINFIYFLGKPAVVRDEEIEKIKELLIKYPDAELMSLQHVSVGDRVRIKNGILANKNGQVLKVNGKKVLMVLENLDFALTTSVLIQDLAAS